MKYTLQTRKPVRFWPACKRAFYPPRGGRSTKSRLLMKEFSGLFADPWV
jgi:hypothetical protein